MHNLYIYTPIILSVQLVNHYSYELQIIYHTLGLELELVQLYQNYNGVCWLGALLILLISPDSMLK